MDERDRRVPTGLPELDAVSGGFVRGEVVAMAGEPGSGKTATALQMAAGMVSTGEHRVGVVSLELGPRALEHRLAFTAEAGKRNLMDNIRLHHRRGISLSELSESVVAMCVGAHVDVVFLDYLGLVAGGQDAGPSSCRNGVWAELKRLASEYALVIVVLVQAPRSYSLEWCASACSHADVVLSVTRADGHDQTPSCEPQVLLRLSRGETVATATPLVRAWPGA